MNIDITKLVTEGDMFDFSASRLERGDNAGPETWQNACAEGATSPLLAEDELEEARDWFADFGAWDAAERAAWTPAEVNALVIQFVAGEWREMEALASDDDGEIDWAEVERLAEQGTIAGNIWPDADGRIWFNMDR